jgi:predicted nucleotidyltransferase
MKNISLNNLPEDFLKTLQTAFEEYAVDFSLIGAFARNYHFEQKGETRYRSTKDVDWVVSVSSTQKFDEMIAFLCANNFQRASDSKFRLIYDRRIDVDIIPFGEIENEPNYAEWANSDNWGLMSTQGLREIVAHSSIVNIKDISINTASLESIVLLKLIAYNDRPERRKKDAEDIAVILSRYFMMMTPEIFNE